MLFKFELYICHHTKSIKAERWVFSINNISSVLHKKENYSIFQRFISVPMALLGHILWMALLKHTHPIQILFANFTNTPCKQQI